jgi:hypothetical protein
MDLLWFHAFRRQTVVETLTVLRIGPGPNPSPTCTAKVNEAALGISPPQVYAYLGRTTEAFGDSCLLLPLDPPDGSISPFDSGGLVEHIKPVADWDSSARAQYLSTYSWPSREISSQLSAYPTLDDSAQNAYLHGAQPSCSGPHALWGGPEADIWQSANDWPAWTWELRCPNLLPTGDRVRRWTCTPATYVLLVEYIETHPDEVDALMALIDSYYEGGVSELHAAFLRGEVA